MSLTGLTTPAVYDQLARLVKKEDARLQSRIATPATPAAPTGNAL
jgi:hypothetical protein